MHMIGKTPTRRADRGAGTSKPRLSHPLCYIRLSASKINSVMYEVSRVAGSLFATRYAYPALGCVTDRGEAIWHTTSHKRIKPNLFVSSPGDMFSESTRFASWRL